VRAVEDTGVVEVVYVVPDRRRYTASYLSGNWAAEMATSLLHAAPVRHATPALLLLLLLLLVMQQTDAVSSAIARRRKNTHTHSAAAVRHVVLLDGVAFARHVVGRRAAAAAGRDVVRRRRRPSETWPDVVSPRRRRRRLGDHRMVGGDRARLPRQRWVDTAPADTTETGSRPSLACRVKTDRRYVLKYKLDFMLIFL